MAWPDINVYDQRPVSWRGTKWNRPSRVLPYMRTLTEIYRWATNVDSGKAASDLDITGPSIPLGYTQDLTIYAYYEVKAPATKGDLDDDDWWFEIQAGNSTEQVTLLDGTVWDQDPAVTGEAWFGAETVLPDVTAAEAQGTTVPGQPLDGLGIKRWRIQETGGTDMRPDSMGGMNTWEWVRVRLRAAISGVQINTPHFFSVRVYCNRWMWEDQRNPHGSPLVSQKSFNRVLFGSGANIKVETVAYEYRPMKLDRSSWVDRPSQVKA